jgi:hypothetical protein
LPDTTKILWVPDTHSGSLWSVYPRKTLQLLSGPRGPSELQAELHKHWIEVAEYAALAAKEEHARLVIVVTGDEIEHRHHDSQEVVSSYLTDHKTIHRELMTELLAIAPPDRLYYVSGTPCHAGEEELDLANVLGAERYSPNSFVWPVLKKRVGGKLIYARHHGPAAGKGMSRGNALRQSLKNIYYENIRNEEEIPDLVVSAHTHKHHKEIVSFGKREIIGAILPSWKLLDEHMNRIDAFAFSNVGSMLTTITPGKIENEFLCIHIDQTPIGDL